LSQSLKICPTCESSNQADAKVCTTCGADLRRISPVARTEAHSELHHYDFRQGETDLLESSVSGSATFYLILSLTLIIVVLAVLLGLSLTGNIFAPAPEATSAEVLSSPSHLPPLNAATVTLGPPTATQTYTPAPSFTPTITPTPGPCIITLPQGQNLTWALAQCGHRSLDVVPTVLAMNNMSDDNSVREGQVIEIPWPTATLDPNAQPTATVEGDANADNSSIVLVDESIEAFQPTTTPTLPPGVMWHQVMPDENIIVIAMTYNTNLQTLSQLNRQMDFARCDFGQTFGGPECIVQLFQGQMLRVPAPTPLPTLSPTFDPNSTATPTATATYNEPQVYSPTDRQFFYLDELVTLRWVPSATLNSGESYRVDMHDLTSNQSYVGYTSEIFFTLPSEWQGKEAERHEYEWTVGIVSQEDMNSVRYKTEPHSFVWQGIIPPTESQE
jgi:hypothetical protein